MIQFKDGVVTIDRQDIPYVQVSIGDVWRGEAWVKYGLLYIFAQGNYSATEWNAFNKGEKSDPTPDATSIEVTDTQVRIPCNIIGGANLSPFFKQFMFTMGAEPDVARENFLSLAESILPFKKEGDSAWGRGINMRSLHWWLYQK